MFSIAPVYDGFVAEVTDVNIANPLEKSVFERLKDALNQYAVLIFPAQPLTEEQQLEFAQLFGPLELSVGATIYNADGTRRVSKPELSDISNLGETGDILDKDDIRHLINLSNRLWHSDSSFKRTPASVSILSAQEVVPIGGATEFADMRAAWDALPSQTQQKIKTLVAEHDYFHSRSLTGFDTKQVPQEWRDRQPPVPQVLVRQHIDTGRHSLYLGAHISKIYDMDTKAGRELVDELMSFATQRQFVYRHRWRQDDVVIWDNRCTMHRGQPFDSKYRRAMRRATVQDTGPTVSPQEGAHA